MSKYQYTQYQQAYIKAVKTITEIYRQHETEDETVIHAQYKQKHLDPDGKTVRNEFDIKCTADGLLSIYRICNMEQNVTNILPVYERYRYIPIFFFPSEVGGINTSRAKVFGDKIDHTLYDLKTYYTAERANCRLLNAYNRPKTKQWLDKMQTFENLVDWWGIKGIFTDLEYNIFDLEYYDNSIITELYGGKKYQYQWSMNYYNNLKKKIDAFYRYHTNSNQNGSAEST